MPHSGKKKKTILFVNNSPVKSGAEVSLLSILKGLDKTRYNPVVITPHDTCFCSELRLYARVTLARLPRLKRTRSVRGMIKTAYLLLQAALSLVRAMKKHSVDILYANSTQAAVCCLPARILTGKKLIWQVRDNIENRWLAWLLGLLAHRIVFPSAWLAGQLRPFASKKTILPNFITPGDAVPERRASIRQTLLLSPCVLLIGHVGQLIPWKNHEDAILAFDTLCRKHRDVHLVFIGADLFGEYEAYRKRLDHLIREKGLIGKVSFIGYREDIACCLQELSLLIHTAKKEPFGRVVLEAMTAGKPVICYNSGGPAELVCDNHTGCLVDIGEGHRGLARRLAQLVDYSESRHRMGEAAAAYAAGHFRAGKLIGDIQQVLDRL